jgi:hypothetical protein
MAVGYIHEFELTDFNKYLSESILKGNVINPFFVVAKRFGQNYHTLIYTGPEIIKHYSETVYSTNWQINASFHYMITGTRNFIGVEFNQEVWKESYSMVIRPQMRLAINEQLMVGIVAGIPVSKDNERMSSFMRIIYEPAHKARLKHHEEVK